MVRRSVIFPLWHGLYTSTPPDLTSRLAGLDRHYDRPVTACLGTAARLHGFDTENTVDIHIHDPGERHLPGQPGLVVHQRLSAPLTEARNRVVTAPAWTAVEVARELRRSRALATLDAALASATITADDLRRPAQLVGRIRHHLRTRVPAA